MSESVIFRSPWPELSWPDCSIPEAILGEARSRGSKAAVIESESGRVMTYEVLGDTVDRLAASLARQGFGPGQVLAIALPNSIDFILAYYGALRAGGIVTTMNPLYTPREMTHQLHDSGARFLVTLPEPAVAAGSEVERVFVPGGNFEELLTSTEPPPSLQIDPKEVALLPYSSGTTGYPKGVMLTHSNAVANVWQIYSIGEFSSDDVAVNYVPFYHVGAMNCILNPMLGVGATIVTMKRFDLETWLALNERYRATYLLTPPPVVLAVSKYPHWERYQLGNLSKAMSGAAPLGAEVQRAFDERTGLMMRQLWGMTETSAPITMTPNDPARRKLGGSGQLLPSIEARVIDISSGRDLGPNERGELWVRGPNVMKGYWKNPNATAACLHQDGWLRTGDIGYFDNEECVFLVDRLKEFIKYNALQVAPAELEEILQVHPAVLEAAVIGIPDEEAGEIPKAFVVLREGAYIDAVALMAFVAERVAPYKKVRALEFVTEIPKSPTGKILRRLLIERERARAAAAEL